MKKIKILLLSGITLLLAFSCSRQVEPANGLYHLDLRKVFAAGESPANLSALAPSLFYVPLETTPGSMLKRVSKVLLHKDQLFVSDNEVVLQFDLQGNFVRQIGRVGNGPGEYSGPIRFALNPVHHEVVVCTSGPRTGQVLRYDVDTGAFKADFEVVSHVCDLVGMPDGSLSFFTREFPIIYGPVDINEIYITDHQGVVTDSIASPGRLTNRINSAGYASVFLQQHELSYLYNFHDTLYRLTSDMEKLPQVVFQRGNTINSEELLFEPTNQVQFPDYVWVSRLTGNQRYLFALVNQGFAPLHDNSRVKRVVFDKQKEALFATTGFANDLDGGMPFWPGWISDGMLIDSYLPHQIIDHYQSTKGSVNHGADFVALAQSLKEDDNPVLVLIQQ